MLQAGSSSGFGVQRAANSVNLAYPNNDLHRLLTGLVHNDPTWLIMDSNWRA